MIRVLATIAMIQLAGATAHAQVLAAMEEEIQEQSQWCWAAVTCAILNYYGGDWTQCEVAELTRQVSDWTEHDFGDDDCCEVPDGACNYPNENEKPPDGSIEDLLERNDIDNEMEMRILSEAEVIAESAAFRPFVMRREYYGSIGHFVAARGMAEGMVHFMDPWQGEGFGMGTYDDVVGGDGYNYVWTSTNIISTSPTCACSTTDACCDGCRPMNEDGACDDDDPCTHTDVCTAAGACAGTAYTCDDGNPCTDDACDGTGGCTTSDNTEPCDDGDPCTEGDTCASGSCEPGAEVPLECVEEPEDTGPVIARSACAACGAPVWILVVAFALRRPRRR